MKTKIFTEGGINPEMSEHIFGYLLSLLNVLKKLDGLFNLLAFV